MLPTKRLGSVRTWHNSRILAQFLQLYRTGISSDLRRPVVRVGHGPTSGEIAGFQLTNPKPGSCDEFVNPAIQVAAAAESFPRRRAPLLPL